LSIGDNVGEGGQVVELTIPRRELECEVAYDSLLGLTEPETETREISNSHLSRVLVLQDVPEAHEIPDVQVRFGVSNWTSHAIIGAECRSERKKLGATKQKNKHKK